MSDKEITKKMALREKQSKSNELTVLTDSNFYSEITKHKLMVVDFWAQWCGPCAEVSPVMEELASEYTDRVTFGKLNVDDNPMVSETYGVDSIPAILVFKQGRQVDGLVRSAEKSYIESRIKPYLEDKLDAVPE
jgi:thioredoxin 1